MDFSTFLTPLEELHDCAICPRDCHADRFKGNTGYCRSGASFSISSICAHHGEEPAVSGREGICNIFFAHCNMQCIYCQNWQISANKIPVSTFRMEIADVISQVTDMLDSGIRRVGFVSPSHYIPQVRAIIRIIESLGYDPIWVYNTNGYEKPGIIQSFEGLIDVYLPDYKYMDPGLAALYSDAPAYPEVVLAALKEMYRQKGAALHLADDGTAESGIIIRHLVLPGHTGNSLGVLQSIAENLSPSLHISLMSQYWPTPAVSCHPRLGIPVTAAEYSRVVGEMERLGMHNGWIQDPESSGNYLPDFDRSHPFN